MYLRVLGNIDAVIDGERTDIAGGKERTLLALLVAHAGRTVSVDRLIEELWPADPPASAASGVHVFVSRLRRRLGERGGDRLRRGPGGYQLDIGPGELDATDFEALVAQAHHCLEQDDPESALRRFGEADLLWRGTAFCGLGSDAIRAEATRLEELRLAAREARFDAELALGGHAGILGELDAATRDFPLRERFWAQRMLALYRCGRQADALSAYRALRDITRSELGSEPTPELQRLNLAVLHHDRSLERAAAPATSLRPGQAKVLWDAYQQGRLGEVADVLDDLSGVGRGSAALDASRAIVAAQRGDHGLAWGLVDGVAADDFAALADDVAWLGTLCLIASTAATIGHTVAARAAQARLEPYAGQFGLLWSGVCSGPVDLHLGRVARTLGDDARAAYWFGRAATLSHGMGMRPAGLTAQVELLDTELARLVAAGEGAGVEDRIESLRLAAVDLGMTRLAGRLLGLHLLVRDAEREATAA